MVVPLSTVGTDPEWTPPQHLPPYTSAYSKPLQPHPSYYQPSHHNPVPPGNVAPEKSKWMIPLCYEPKDDVRTCCLGCWCPAILYGHTQYRLRQLEKSKDPLDMSDYKNALRYTFGRVFIMAQHSRIRDRYNIEGTVCCDCLSSYFCPSCSLMQADREIRARETKKANMEKPDGTVKHQPKTEPNMEYPAFSLFENGTLQERDGLVGQEITTASTKQSNTARSNDQNGGKLHKSEHSKHHAELNKFRKDLKAKGGNGETKGKTRNVTSRDSQLSNDGPTSTIQLVNHGQEDPDTVYSSWPTSRYQKFFGKQDRGLEHSLSTGFGDSNRSSENQDPMINRCTLRENSEDLSLSQFRGKRVLKKLAKAESRSRRVSLGNTSESLADEPVLVFYGDGDRPQRHLLADCARFRSSTVGRTDTPHEREQEAGWRIEKIVGGDGQSGNLISHTLDACQEDFAVEEQDRAISEDVVNDRAMQVMNSDEDTKPNHDLSHLLENCPNDSTLVVSDTPVHQDLTHSLGDCNNLLPVKALGLTEPKAGNPESIQQHGLDRCPVDPVLSTDSMHADGYFQHNLADCAEKSPEYASVSSTEITPNVDLPIPEQLNTNQHHLVDCASAIVAPFSVDSGVIKTGPKIHSYQSDTQSRSNLESEQNEHVVTITVPQPPVIIVTTSEALEEAIRKEHDPTGARNPEIIIVSQDTRASIEPLPGVSCLIRDHDGAADNQDASQLYGAVAVMQTVVHAAVAADEKHVRIAAAIEESNTNKMFVNAPAKKSSTRSRDKTVGGRVKGKGKL